MAQPSFDDWKAGVQQAITLRWPGSQVSQIEPDALDAAFRAGLSPVAFVVQGVPWIPAGPPVIRDPLTEEIVGMHSSAGLWFGFGLSAVPGVFGLLLMCVAGGRAQHAIIEAEKLGLTKQELEARSRYYHQMLIGAFIGIFMAVIFWATLFSSARGAG
jgi:hypothetical protein